jgi:hypothetical protein
VRSRCASFEALEDRRLLSGLPGFSMLVPMSADILDLEMAIDRSGGNQSSITSMTSTTTRDTTPTQMPNLVGDWAGKVKATVLLFITRKLSFTMHVASQTAESITGSVSASGHTYNGTLPVTWSGRDFIMNYKDSKISGKLNGTVNDAGNQITGTLKGKGYGLSARGTIKLDKVA